MITFGIEFVPIDIYWKTIFYSIQAEKKGFDYIWITDHFNNRNVYVLLSLISVYTEKIQLGPGITNPYLVNPIITAQTMTTLSEIAPNRIVCGLGAGDKTTLNMLNIKQKKPLSTIRESAKIIRQITSGRKLQINGRIYKFSEVKLNFKTDSPIPLFIGAQGPKMLSLAGEIADGVLINSSNPVFIKKSLELINKGAMKSNKKIEEMIISAYTAFSIASNIEEAIKAAKPVVAFIISGSPEIILNQSNVSIKKAEEIRNAILKRQWKEAFSKVDEKMIEKFSICGTPDICIKKIKELLRIGVNQIVIGSPIGLNIRQSIDNIAENVLPVFK
jgi:5,10-methylenetetrahydromethanopterin reductase